jgi:ABC-2 type transport system permease protein
VTTTAPPVPAHAAGPTRALAGTGTLIRFVLRRDRVRIPVWIGAITFFTVLTASAFPDLYLTQADRQARAALMENPGVRTFSGPGYGLDNYTFGAMMAQEMLSWIAIFTALMSILLMVRHTRAEEETGRAELVRAAVVGRHAHTAAALLVVGGASVVLGVVMAAGLGVLGIETITWAGSWLFGAALASVGVVFAAVTAVTAQINEHARGAGGMAGAAFAFFFLLRGAGDMIEIGGSLPSWLSPVGWAQQTRVYVDDRWWPLLLPAVFTAALVAVALWLSVRRDLGASLVRPRPGPATGSRLLSSPLGLAWRQHRSAVIWWSVALFLFGVGYGSLAAEVEAFVNELAAFDEWMAQIGGARLIDSFLSVIVMLISVAVAVFAVLTVLRPRGEETAGRAEPLLATAVSRIGWTASHLVMALAGSLVLLALAGAGLGLTASAVLDDAELLPRVVGAALAYAPAVWLTVGLGVALFGLLPRASLLVWLVIVYAGVVGMFAPLLGLPDWMVNLSPFGHVPMLPAAALEWRPLLLLAGIAAALIAAGLYGFRQRDLDTK